MMIKDAIAAGGPTPAAAGSVSLVGAGPGSGNLITLRGVQRPQEADIIFYDRLIDDAVLELARPDAERVFVGKTPGLATWPQDRINGVVVAAARQGKRVVRLKCCDPGIFARGAEEAAALDAAGIAWEIVPGVTAASAAAAAAGAFLTERCSTDTVVLTTGQSCGQSTAPDWASSLRPGVTLAIYMGVSAAARIQGALAAAGHDPNLQADIAAAVGTQSERHVRTTLGRLAATIAEEKLMNPAILIIRCPKPAHAVAASAA